MILILSTLNIAGNVFYRVGVKSSAIKIVRMTRSIVFRFSSIFLGLVYLIKPTLSFTREFFTTYPAKRYFRIPLNSKILDKMYEDTIEETNETHGNG